MWELESDYYLHNSKFADNVLLWYCGLLIYVKLRVLICARARTWRSSLPWWRKPLEDFEKGIDKQDIQMSPLADDENPEPEASFLSQSPLDLRLSENAHHSGRTDGPAIKKTRKWVGKGGSFDDFYRVRIPSPFD